MSALRKCIIQQLRVQADLLERETFIVPKPENESAPQKKFSIKDIYDDVDFVLDYFSKKYPGSMYNIIDIVVAIIDQQLKATNIFRNLNKDKN